MSADPCEADMSLFAAFPGVRIDHDNKHYYRGLLERRLLLNRCAECGMWHHPPKASCPRCWSWSVVPTEVSGRGEVYLLSFLNDRPAHGATSASVSPFPVAVVEFAEGVRFTTTIIDCPKEAMTIGIPVELHWIERNGMPFPAVRPEVRP